MSLTVAQKCRLLCWNCRLLLQRPGQRSGNLTRRQNVDNVWSLWLVQKLSHVLMVTLQVVYIVSHATWHQFPSYDDIIANLGQFCTGSELNVANGLQECTQYSMENMWKKKCWYLTISIIQYCLSRVLKFHDKSLKLETRYNITYLTTWDDVSCHSEVVSWNPGWNQVVLLHCMHIPAVSAWLEISIDLCPHHFNFHLHSSCLTCHKELPISCQSDRHKRRPGFPTYPNAKCSKQANTSGGKVFLWSKHRLDPPPTRIDRCLV